MTATAHANSASRNWPQVDERPTLYLPMAEAVRRARNSPHYDGSRNQNTLRWWCRNVASKCTTIERPAVMFDGDLYVHPQVHPAFSEPAAVVVVDDDFSRQPTHRKNRAIAKQQVLRDFDEYRSRHQSLGKIKALTQFVKLASGQYRFDDRGTQKPLKFTVRTALKWIDQYASGGLSALVADGRGSGGARDLSGVAVEYYWYLRNDPRKFSIAHCHRMVRHEADANGWKWFESEAACRRWDVETRDPESLTFNREGERKWRAKFSPKMLPDPESFGPGEYWEGDHSTVNAWVRWHDGKIIRPVLTLWLDWRSRAVVGYRVVRDGSQDSILCAFRDGAQRFGLPSRLIIDNGKDYSAYTFTGGVSKERRFKQLTPAQQDRFGGIFAMMQIDARWAPPYSPNSKARIERSFGTFDDQFVRMLPSYCGNTPDNRPGAHVEIAAKAIDVDDFTAKLDAWMTHYNEERPHSGEGMNGYTPVQVMQTAAQKRVLLDEHAKELYAVWKRPISKTANGLRLVIRGASIYYGFRDRCIQELKHGTKVHVCYDPEDVRSVQVWHDDGRYIGEARWHERTNRAVSSDVLSDHQKHIKRKKRLMREARKLLFTGGASNDPAAAALAAQRTAASKARKPDPDKPDGGPALKPVHPTIEVPKRPRRALHNEPIDKDFEERKRLLAEAAIAEQEARRKSGHTRKDDIAERILSISKTG